MEHCCLPSCREAVRDTGALPELESCRWPPRRVLSCRQLVVSRRKVPVPIPPLAAPKGCEDCLLELVVAEKRRTKILVVECCCLLAKTLLSLGVVTPE